MISFFILRSGHRWSTALRNCPPCEKPIALKPFFNSGSSRIKWHAISTYTCISKVSSWNLKIKKSRRWIKPVCWHPSRNYLTIALLWTLIIMLVDRLFAMLFFSQKMKTHNTYFFVIFANSNRCNVHVFNVMRNYTFEISHWLRIGTVAF